MLLPAEALLSLVTPILAAELLLALSASCMAPGTPCFPGPLYI